MSAALKYVVLSSGGATTPWYQAGGAPAPDVVYQPTVAASLAASYTNLIAPGTNDAAPGVAPTWNATDGWIFNGSTQYLTTGILPNTGGTYLIQFTSISGATSCLFASDPTGGSDDQRVMILPLLSSTIDYWNGGRAGATQTPTITGGILAMAGNKAYRNGTDEGVTLPAWIGSASTKQIYIGARNNADTADLFLTGKVQAFAKWSTTLTAPQMAAIAFALAPG